MSPSVKNESLSQLITLLKILLPEFKEFLADVKAEKGHLNLPAGFAELLIKGGQI